MRPTWTAEMYTDAAGRCPIQGWFDGLSGAKFAAIDAAILHVLQPSGLELAGTGWLKPLKEGLYEFRVRSTAAEIVRMYADAGHAPPDDVERILLRVFVAFHSGRAQVVDGVEGPAGPGRQAGATPTVVSLRLTIWARAHNVAGGGGRWRRVTRSTLRPVVPG